MHNFKRFFHQQRKNVPDVRTRSHHANPPAHSLPFARQKWDRALFSSNSDFFFPTTCLVVCMEWPRAPDGLPTLGDSQRGVGWNAPLAPLNTSSVLFPKDEPRSSGSPEPKKGTAAHSKKSARQRQERVAMVPDGHVMGCEHATHRGTKTERHTHTVPEAQARNRDCACCVPRTDQVRHVSD